MSRLRFQHVFAALMVLSLASAFVLPAYTTPLEPQLQALFAPVSRPSRGAAGWAHARLYPPQSPDQRDAADVKAENDRLRATVARLNGILGVLEQRAAERKKLGAVGELVEEFPVVGSDPGLRESLLLQGSKLEGLRENQFVLYPDGIVGRVQPGRAGMAGAQVRLITDVGSRALGQFGTFRRVEVDGEDVTEFVPLAAPPVLVEGVGRGGMVVRQLTMDQVKESGLKVGHDQWVVLADPDWPDYLQGLRLGTVVKIDSRRDAPLFAEIRVEPVKDLLKLNKVMVVTRE